MLSPLVAPKPLRIPSPRTDIRQDEEDSLFRAPDDHLQKSCGREAVEDPSEEVQRILDEEKSPRNLVSPKAKHTPLSTPRAKRTPISTPKASGPYEEGATFRARGPSFLFTAASPKAAPSTISPKAGPTLASPKAATTSVTTPRAAAKDEQKNLSSPRMDPTQRSPPIAITITPRVTPRSSHAPTPTAATGPATFKRDKPPRSREISPMTMLPPSTHDDPEQEFASEDDELDNMTPPARCNNPTPAAWDMRSSTPIEISLHFTPIIRTPGEHAYSY